MGRTLERQLAILSTVLITAMGGCDTAGDASTTGSSATSGPESSPPAGEKSGSTEEKNYRYSPFGVRLKGSKHFDLVSFKDVGLGPSGTTDSERLLEAIAQSIAFEFRTSDVLKVNARTIYDRRLADPDHHKYCEAERLYVDVWRADGEDQWGYSLWSGCSKAMNFAWREVPMPTDPESGELERAIEPLAEGIRKSLAEAKSEHCFRRTC
ncbi:MAG: hypothetical protein ABEL76_11980 [Bradymonadaceae bacterium]